VEILFHKMQGAQNEFIVVDRRQCDLPDELAPLVQHLCDAETGIGADGVIFFAPGQQVDMHMYFFNPDGSEVDFCGNGARCLAWLSVHLGLSKQKIRIQTGAGTIDAELINQEVQLTLGHFNPPLLDVKLSEKMSVDVIQIGVPHAVLWVDQMDHIDLDIMGPQIRSHAHFASEGTNANWATYDEEGVIHMRTYERGVEGETLACGSGAVAVAITAVKRSYSHFPVTVICAGGDRLIVDLVGDEITLRGGAVLEYSGVWKNGIRL
jgi:diaminopimelate epimerase